MLLRKITLLLLVIISVKAGAQTIIQTNKIVQEEKPVYLGGGIVLGGGSGSFQLGLNPELIQSYNQYIDLGLAVNLYYSSYKSQNDKAEDYKLTNTQVGLGTLIRAWPIEQFFVQLQPEYNWTFTNAKNITIGTSPRSSTVSAPSVLAGLGYGKRSEHGFSYFSIMFDLVNSAQSPYRMGQLKAQPIFRAGVGFPIRFPKKKNLK
jgi:hypothetical protein